jgi:hypothetical protein
MALCQRIRITAELIDAEREKPLWARSFERDLGDVFALQDDVARAITEEQHRIAAVSFPVLLPVRETRIAYVRNIYEKLTALDIADEDVQEFAGLLDAD